MIQYDIETGGSEEVVIQADDSGVTAIPTADEDGGVALSDGDDDMEEHIDNEMDSEGVLHNGNDVNCNVGVKFTFYV